MGFACEGLAEGVLGGREEKGTLQIKRDQAKKALSRALA